MAYSLKRDTYLYVDVSFDKPPCPLRFGIYVRHKDKLFGPGMTSLFAHDGSKYGYQYRHDDWDDKKHPIKPGDKIDIVLKPFLERSDQMISSRSRLNQKAWAGEIVIKDVVVP